MRILIVGLGSIGQRHLRNLRAVLGENAEIRAVSRRRGIPVLTDQLQVEAGATLEEKLGLRLYPLLEPALAWAPEAVFICSPTSLHVPQALLAARAGCALFIEKPLSHSLEQVEELIRLAESRRLVAAVGFQMRFHPCLQRLNSLVREKAVGRILSVRAEIGEYLPAWHGYEDYRRMYASRKELGGGVILTQIHEMDYLLWLFGRPRSVYALGGRFSRLEIDVEDTADILMSFAADGASFPVGLHQDYLQRPPRRFCEVLGEDGRILADLNALSVDVFDGGGRQVEGSRYAGFERNRMFVDELESFLACLRGASSPTVGLREAADSLRLALAAKESLATGKVVDMV